MESNPQAGGSLPTLAGSDVWGPLEQGTEGTPSEPLRVDADQRYIDHRLVGQGGMGRVSAVHDQRLDRIVATKELRRDQAFDRHMRARLCREAQITAALEHPGIVPIYDAGTDEQGRLYYTMRLVQGRSMQAALETLADAEARMTLLRHFLSACEAIAYAHSRSVIHRDLKPHNIMIGDFGETQVVDWGLARRLTERDDAGERTDSSIDPVDPSMTADGTVLGSRAWMSPEQARGEVVDARADVWSLGAILYALLFGSPPTSAERERAGETARPSTDEGPRLGWRQLEAIARRALAREPRLRYADAGALAADVRRFLDGQLVRAHDYSRWELLL